MTPEQLLQVRAAQSLPEIDAFIKSAAGQGVIVPQALRDAIEALREAVKQGDSP